MPHAGWYLMKKAALIGNSGKRKTARDKSFTPSRVESESERRRRTGLVIPFLGRLAPCVLPHRSLPLLLQSPPRFIAHPPRIPRPNATNHLVQSSPPPARSSRTAPPPTRPDPNRRPDLGAAVGAPSHGPRRRPAALLRCDATRRRHPPPTQPPRHPSSAAASSCSSPGPARSSSCPFS